jgi:hypothetical protein
MNGHTPALQTRERIGPIILLATGMLGLGVLVYLFDRLPGSTYFLPAPWQHFADKPITFGNISGWLPEFAHVYAFSLFTAAVLGTTRRVALTSCSLWWLIDSLFEIGQYPNLSPHLVVATPAWFDGIPFLENTGAFFAHGTFDPADLIAITLGALAAWVTLSGLHNRKEGYNHVRIQQS